MSITTTGQSPFIDMRMDYNSSYVRTSFHPIKVFSSFKENIERKYWGVLVERDDTSFFPPASFGELKIYNEDNEVFFEGKGEVLFSDVWECFDPPLKACLLRFKLYDMSEKEVNWQRDGF